MAARKLQQEVDKCFKKVAEGIAEFESIYDKLEQSNNQAQKEKQEDNLKREIKKLQRLRDQIKTWAASNDIKDKAPLMEQRRLIETQMEKFKAVEKAMKTKAYSKEGLSAAAKLDPKEQAKLDAGEFLSNTVDELEQQIEALEVESEQLSATMKKGKSQRDKAERIARIEQIIEKHKWHQGKLELIRRSLENGGVDTDQVMELEEMIKYYVAEGQSDDFPEDEGLYDELDLEEEEGAFGMAGDDKNSSQDGGSVVNDEATPEPEPAKPKKPVKEKEEPPAAATAVGGPAAAIRKSSAATRSPLPALATLHTPLSTISNGSASGPVMKPAQAPARPAEGLKYASAAAAAAASEKSNVGIAPLPPPPGAPGPSSLPDGQSRASATNSPASASIQPAQHDSKQSTPAMMYAEPEIPITISTRGKKSKAKAAAAAAAAAEASVAAAKAQPTNGHTNGIKPIEEEPEEESIYHLPSSLQDLVDAYEAAKDNRPHPASGAAYEMMKAAWGTEEEDHRPTAADAEPPSTYQRNDRVAKAAAAARFPTQPLALFGDPRLYSRIDPDTLFYVFYYQQGTPYQLLAAQWLKHHAWRFHKQYQTWFQRHEEPKSITEDYEQGTYRFFDYESTWMNRRKADFKFVYKFLEDD